MNGEAEAVTDVEKHHLTQTIIEAEADGKKQYEQRLPSTNLNLYL